MEFDFDPKKTALLVIDMQNDFVKPGAPMQVPKATDMVPKLQKLLNVCRAKRIPVLYTAHVHSPDGSDWGLMGDFWEPIRNRTALMDGTEGADIYKEVYPAQGEPVIKKHRYSGFYGTDLEIRLRNMGIEAVAITGTVTNICCESTARDAQFRDFKVVFLNDVTGAMDIQGKKAEEVQEASCASVNSCVAMVMDTERFLKKIA